MIATNEIVVNLLLLSLDQLLLCAWLTERCNAANVSEDVACAQTLL